MSTIDNVITAILNAPRKIGAIAIQCSIEETHHDELQITDHPVEQGAQISDHAFKKPAEVVIRAGWSNSGIQSVITELSQAASLLSNAALNFSGTTSPFNYSGEVYQQLLTLQASRQPFEIITGKRVYSNMLIRSISVPTDEKKEHALFCTIICRQVLIVRTQATTFTPLEDQASPQKTAQTENAGVKQLSVGSPSPGGSSPPSGSADTSAWGNS